MKEELYKLAGGLRTTYQKKINNTYIWSSLARDALSLASTNDIFLDSEKVQVPTRTSGKKKTITRKKSDLVKILVSAENADFNFSIHTYIVAQVEAFLSDLIRGVLKIDKRKLKTRVQGIDHVKKVDVSLILDSDSIDEMIDDLINKELVGVFYASPEKQFEYLQKVVGVKVDDKLEELFDKWKEYKATRDLIVHNLGVVNEVYLAKAGDYSRGTLGDHVSVSKEYIDSLVAETKSLIGRISNSIQRQNKV
jgi:hypothetical protein